MGRSESVSTSRETDLAQEGMTDQGMLSALVIVLEGRNSRGSL
jgi:hypothetical protein